MFLWLVSSLALLHLPQISFPVSPFFSPSSLYRYMSLSLDLYITIYLPLDLAISLVYSLYRHTSIRLPLSFFFFFSCRTPGKLEGRQARRQRVEELRLAREQEEVCTHLATMYNGEYIQ